MSKNPVKEKNRLLKARLRKSARFFTHPPVLIAAISIALIIILISVLAIGLENIYSGIKSYNNTLDSLAASYSTINKELDARTARLSSAELLLNNTNRILSTVYFGTADLGEKEEANRFRGDIYYDNDVLVGNFRRVNRELFPIENLNIPEPVLKRLNLRHEKSGLILITGITGSGKSTTLDSIINLNNEENEGHIVIISDPLEFIHKSKKCIIRHREVGGDVLSFREGTIQALRQDPDIIIVGEMRDAPTIATVLEATDSGHKVFTTLHTSSAVESIHRIIAEFLPEEQERIRLRLADTLSVVISQKLVPDRDNKLTLVKEILSVTDSVKAAIRNKNIGEIYQMITDGKKYGMVTMEQDLHNLYTKKIISRETALDFSNNRKRIEQLLSFREICV